MERDAGLKNMTTQTDSKPGHTDQGVELLLDATREAERVLEQEARLHPTYADIRHRLGLLCLLRKDPIGAEREFEEALGINPGYRAALFGLRLARLQQGIMVDVLPPVDETTEISVEEVTWRAIDEAWRAFVAGTNPLAALSSKEGHVGELLNNIYSGYFLYRAGKLDKARFCFDKAAAGSPVAKSTLNDLGLDRWQDQSEDEIGQALDTLLWTPLADDLYTYLGKIYARNGLRTEALGCFGRAYLVMPHNAKHAVHNAEIAIAFGEEDEALSLLTTAIEEDPGNIKARIALGYEYASQGFLNEAREQFHMAAKLAPGYADVRYNLALLFMGENQVVEALEEFKASLAINPSYLPARHSMAHLLCRSGQYEAGLKEYTRILKQGFKSGDMLVQMGKAALALDRSEDALLYLEQAIYLNPDFAASYYYLGQVYQRKGLKNKARSAWRNYLERANEWDPLNPIGSEAESA
jgi:tetratricopeptide (TPR) repeat protein